MPAKSQLEVTRTQRPFNFQHLEAGSNFILIISYGQNKKKIGWIRCDSSEGEYHSPTQERGDIDHTENTTTSVKEGAGVKE